MIKIAVEQPEARHLAARDPHVAAPVKIEAVAQVLRRVAGVHLRRGAQQLEPLLEAEHAARRLELLGDRAGQLQRPAIEGLSASERVALAAAWQADGLMEHASIASFSRRMCSRSSSC